jgi:hypothetical protein
MRCGVSTEDLEPEGSVPEVVDTRIGEDLRVDGLVRPAEEREPHRVHGDLSRRALLEDLRLHPTGASKTRRSGGGEQSTRRTVPTSALNRSAQLRNPL